MDEEPFEFDIIFPGGVCTYCKHFQYKPIRSNNLFACAAFPAGIPDEISAADFDHRNPYPGDGDIRFELREGWQLPDWIDEDYHKAWRDNEEADE